MAKFSSSSCRSIFKSERVNSLCMLLSPSIGLKHCTAGSVSYIATNSHFSILYIDKLIRSEPAFACGDNIHELTESKHSLIVSIFDIAIVSFYSVILSI